MTDHGKTALIERLPACQHKSCKRRARIDCRTWTGRWGYFCLAHWPLVRASEHLGVGNGQYLYVDPTEDIPAWVTSR